MLNDFKGAYLSLCRDSRRFAEFIEAFATHHSRFVCVPFIYKFICTKFSLAFSFWFSLELIMSFYLQRLVELRKGSKKRLIILFFRADINTDTLRFAGTPTVVAWSLQWHSTSPPRSSYSVILFDHSVRPSCSTILFYHRSTILHPFARTTFQSFHSNSQTEKTPSVTILSPCPPKFERSLRAHHLARLPSSKCIPIGQTTVTDAVHLLHSLLHCNFIVDSEVNIEVDIVVEEHYSYTVRLVQSIAY